MATYDTLPTAALEYYKRMLAGGSSSGSVQGAAADDAAASGNPVLVGGKYEATPNTVEDGDVSTLKTDANGNLRVVVRPASAGTKANVSGSASSVTILAANTSRKSVTIVNDSTAILYLDRTGGTASSTSYTDFLPGTVGGVPTQITINDFTGLITGIWASATGAARVSEYT